MVSRADSGESVIAKPEPATPALLMRMSSLRGMQRRTSSGLLTSQPSLRESPTTFAPSDWK